jgi:transcriptional regulator with XRE-family HTH domain
MQRLSPGRIRKIRKHLGLSRKEFGRILWAAPGTVDNWESGSRAPVGFRHQLLMLMEQNLANSFLSAAVKDPRAAMPMFVVYGILELTYGDRST